MFVNFDVFCPATAVIGTKTYSFEVIFTQADSSLKFGLIFT